MPASDHRVTARWIQGLRSSWFSLAMLGLVVVGVFVIAPTLHLYLTQQQQIAQLEKSNARTGEQIAQLTKQQADWSDPSYIKAQARERLLFVMPGETSYLVIDDRAPVKKKDSTPVSTSIQAAKGDWLGSLADSFVTAGTTRQTATQLSKQVP
jgi:cell division protein FtsB